MIGIIDYEIGNLRSVMRAIEHIGGEAEFVRTPQEMARADKIVLPGVAAFGDAMDQLRSANLVEPLVEAIRGGVPYLGFCLGLQLLFEVSYEAGRHEGLGIFRGEVVRFELDSTTKLSVPHMGWNRIRWDEPVDMFKGVGNGAYVYFAHSYHVAAADDDIIAATTNYGGEFVSAVRKDNVFATQFHPEKSQDVGLKILKNFVEM